MMDKITAANLAEFFSWAVQHSWDGSDIDGCDVQDKAISLGLVTKTKYDPEKHGENAYGSEPGDDWYVVSDTVRAIRDGVST